jgi:DNA repair exonuclease SbcCD nuclease subunit
MADVHLGYKQYGSEERLIDFAQAFFNAMKFAMERKVDFVIIAGDLFHKKSEMDPLTLTQATKVLEKAKQAEIPVIAVEGNHDSTYFREHYSWMDYLAKNDLIINLKPSFEDQMLIEEWDGERGAYIDMGDVRIYGMKYYGSLTEKILDEYAGQIKKKGFTIFVAHAGIEGYMNIYGCISASKFHRLKGKVDYIALGHVHKSFVEDFIFNPGSLETCDVSEFGFEKGIFYVEWDEKLKYQLVKLARRTFVDLSYKMKEDDSVYDNFKRFLESNKCDERSVVSIKISASRNLRKTVSDEKLEKIVKEVFNPIVTRIHWEILDGVFEPITYARDPIERQVIEQLLESYGYGNIADEVLRLKSIFSSSFDIRSVDEFISQIIEKGEKREIEQAEERAGEGAEEGVEEEWDWRKAYDRRGKASKH